MLQFYISNIKKAAVILFLICVCYYGATFISNWLSNETTDNASIDADITLVSSEVEGTISKVFISDNNKVKAGDILVAIDDVNYKSSLQQANIDLKNGENDIYNAEYAIKIEQLNCEKLKSSFEAAKLDFENAEKEFQRISALNKDKFISIKTFEDIKYNFINSRYKLDELKINIETSEQKINSLTTNKLIATSKLDKIREALLQAQKKFDDTKIKSDVNGIVTNISARVGNFTRAGMPIMSIVNDDTMYVRANFKETQIRKFQPNMEAIVTIDALPGVKIKGIIRNIAPATGSKFSLLPVGNATGNFTKVVQRVTILIDIKIPEDYKNFIIPGMSACVSVKVK